MFSQVFTTAAAFRDHPGADTSYTYDASSNRLTASETRTSETDLDALFDQANLAQATGQALKIEDASNRLLGFTQTTTKMVNGQPSVVVTTPVNYSVDANGSMTSDGLRSFDYDASGRLTKVKIYKDGEEAGIRYLHNALGQRVFKSEPKAEQAGPKEEDLGPGFMNWLRRNFGWMPLKGRKAEASLGVAYLYGDAEIPQWALLGEYDNGTAQGRGATEYIWLPMEEGGAIPVGMYRKRNLYAIHTDHLGTPRLMTDRANKPVWQWPYSAFGNNKPGGVIVSSTAPTGQTVLKASKPAVEIDLRFPGQSRDEETGTFYNYFRDYDAATGRYRQADPIGLQGGLSRFAYVHGDPLNFTDPEGLFEWGDPLPDELVNVCAGFGDGVSLGTTSLVRSFMGTNDQVDVSSPEYLGGVVAGALVTGKGYAAGAELSVGRNFRFAPWGNRTGHSTGKYPHYHRRGAPDTKGNTPPGQGIGRHRPWDKKSTDKCGCDRF